MKCFATMKVPRVLAVNKIMSRKSSTALLVLLISILNANDNGSAMGLISKEKAVTVTFFDHGKAVELHKEEAQQLLDEIEYQLSSAGDTIKLAVFPHIIESIRSAELSIEVRYKKKKVFMIRGTQFEIDQILIPLSGKYAGGVTTIFYGKKKYASGPFQNMKGTTILKKTLMEAGVGLGCSIWPSSHTFRSRRSTCSAWIDGGCKALIYSLI
jgi:hypothetical protein